MSFGDRLRALRLQAALTQSQLSSKVGVSDITLRHWEAETRSPSMQNIITLSNVLRVSADELLGLSASGQKLDTLPVSRRESTLLANYRSLDSFGKDAVDGVCAVEKRRCESIIHQSQPIPIARKQRTIPQYVVPSAAGYAAPIDNEDFIMVSVDVEDVPANADFIVKIHGQSMEPFIHDGDTVYVEKTSELSVGDVGIFSIDGSMYCKLYYVDKDGNMTLVSANPDLEDSNIYVSAESNISVECLGKVLLAEPVQFPAYFTDRIEP